MADGDIGANVDTLEFCNTNIANPSIVHVADDIFAIAYTDADEHGMVVTVDINAAGEIENTIVDSLEFDTVGGNWCTIVHVAATFFAISYRADDNDGWVCTVNISALGVIENAIVDSLEFEAGACYEPHLIHHTGTTFAVVYRNAANNGTTTTFSISAIGEIGASPIDTDTFMASHGNSPRIVNVLANVFAITFRTGAYHLHVCTQEIAADGTITTACIENLDITTRAVSNSDICNPIGNIYAIANTGTDSHGYVVTVAISDAGDIGPTYIDELEFDAANANFPSIKAINAGLCAIASPSTGSAGTLYTIEIDGVGEITDAILDSYVFDAADCANPQLINVSGDTYVIAYRGPDDDGWIATPTIERPSLGRTLHLAVLGIG